MFTGITANMQTRCKKIVQNKFGVIEKLFTLLHHKITKLKVKMKLAMLHIESKRWFNPSVDYIIGGASDAVS